MNVIVVDRGVLESAAASDPLANCDPEQRPLILQTSFRLQWKHEITM